MWEGIKLLRRVLKTTEQLLHTLLNGVKRKPTALADRYPPGSWIIVDPRYRLHSKHDFHLAAQQVLAVEEPKEPTKENPYSDPGGVWVAAPDKRWLTGRAFISAEFILAGRR